MAFYMPRGEGVAIDFRGNFYGFLGNTFNLGYPSH